MAIEQLKDLLPEYAKDLKLNLSSMLRGTELSDEQRWGTIVSCAASTRCEVLSAPIFSEAQKYLSPEAFEASLAAASIMGMNNIFYRFTHLSSNQKYSQMRAGLRMNVIRNSGVSSELFELWSLAVSALNGCGMCVDAHERQLKEQGLSEQQILEAVKIASVINGIATAISSEAARHN
jgi:alkyl hydroperoxide reductase subunit D